MDIHLSQIVLYMSERRYKYVDLTPHTRLETGPIRTMAVPGNYNAAKEHIYLAVTDQQTRADVLKILEETDSLIQRCGRNNSSNEVMLLQSRMAWTQSLLDISVRDSIKLQLPFLSDFSFSGPLNFPFNPDEDKTAFSTLLETTEQLMALNGGHDWVKLRIDHNIGNQVMDSMRKMNFLPPTEPVKTIVPVRGLQK